VGANGQTKLLPSSDGWGSVQDALVVYKKKYREKAGHPWEDRHTAVARPGHYTFIEIDYNADDESIMEKVKQQREENAKLEVPESKLDSRIQDFVQAIYNIDMMQKSLLEMEFDLDKMPLGLLIDCASHRCCL
jgi:poly [ADP-ribose] polymerase 2/3/4